MPLKAIRLLPERTKRQGSICSAPAPAGEAAPRFAFWPAPGPNCLKRLSACPRGEPKGKVLSVQPRPVSDLSAFGVLFFGVFGAGESANGSLQQLKVLSVQPRPRRGTELRSFRPAPGPNCLKVYPFTPGENQKARFYPLSPATVGKRRCDCFLGRLRDLILTISLISTRFWRLLVDLASGLGGF